MRNNITIVKKEKKKKRKRGYASHVINCAGRAPALSHFKRARKGGGVGEGYIKRRLRQRVQAQEQGTKLQSRNLKKSDQQIKLEEIFLTALGFFP